MLDTKRLKLSPSSSDRPMSPLAMKKSGKNVRCDETIDERRYMMTSDSESDDLNDGKGLMKVLSISCKINNQ